MRYVRAEIAIPEQEGWDDNETLNRVANWMSANDGTEVALSLSDKDAFDRANEGGPPGHDTILRRLKVMAASPEYQAEVVEEGVLEPYREESIEDWRRSLDEDARNGIVQ